MSKTLCEIKDLSPSKQPDWLWEELRKPRYFCSKCLRSAKSKKRLCKAKRLPLKTTAPDLNQG